MSAARISRTVRVVAACVLQLLLVGIAVAPSLSARVAGEEYLLEVAPLDPIDPFRGAYVTLSYPGLPQPSESRDGKAFVPLMRAGELWRGGPPQRERPDGPYLTCEVDFRLRCGIESLFTSQGNARRLEAELAEGAVARVKVDGRGNAAIVGIQPR